MALGLRQKREGGGSWVRLIIVAAVISTGGVLPLILAVWLNAFLPGQFDLFKVALISTAMSVTIGCLNMMPPVRFQGRREPLPLVTDEPLISRVGELARFLGVSPAPRVRMLGSTGSSLVTLAWAGGLPAPSLVVSDGVLHRVTADERDAIIAHELAHLSTHSLWFYWAVLPIASSVSVLAAVWVSMGVAISFGYALFSGVWRIVSRRTELMCDAAAGRAVGFARTASAFDKIHVVHPFLREGLLTFLVHATATHPSRAERWMSLRDAAPPDEQATMRDESAAARRDRRAARIACGLWIAALLVGLGLGLLRNEAARVSGTVLLFIAASMPAILIGIAAGRQQRVELRRLRGARGSRRMALVGLALLVLSVLGVVVTTILSSHVVLAGYGQLMVLMPTAGAIIGIGLLLLAMVRAIRVQRVRADIEIAIRVHDFARARKIVESSPRYAARDPIVRHNAALAIALEGDRQSAIQSLQHLAEDYAKLPITYLTLAVLCLEADPARSLEHAKHVAPLLPNDPAPLVLVARALRRLGRLIEAEAAVHGAMAIAPADGSVLAAAAGIALDRNEVERARLFLEQASVQAPGDAFVLLTAAELALGIGTPDQAQAAIDAARAAVQAAPLAFLEADLQRLEQRNCRQLTYEHAVITTNMN
jgi:Zn-dependent protease with chaperone function/Flp pilus assembly protein TadD